MLVTGGVFEECFAHFNSSGTLLIESTKQFEVYAKDVEKIVATTQPKVKRSFFLELIAFIAVNILSALIAIPVIFLIFPLLFTEYIVILYPITIFLLILFVISLFFPKKKKEKGPYYLKVLLKSGKEFTITVKHKELMSWPDEFKLLLKVELLIALGLLTGFIQGTSN